MEPGIPVDAADLAQQSRGVQEGLKQMGAQLLGGMVEILRVVVFMKLEPLAVVVKPDAPEKIHRFGGIAVEHKLSSVIYFSL